ncbi:glycosyltransferase [Arcanobacterium hippocoleae]|uniref:glycosyltransferase n=1 Tax=Arcanobacterium hippocoleae TaxID=149017 RepID=UPI003342B461
MSQDQKNPRSIVLAGGGTAGHVNPLLATAGEIQQQSPQTRLTIVGTEYGLEKELVPAAGYELRTISRVPFPRRINAAALKFFRNFEMRFPKRGNSRRSAGRYGSGLWGIRLTAGLSCSPEA